MDSNPLILLTTDFSDDARRAYAPTVELAERLGGRILLLFVVESLTVVAHGSPLAPPHTSPELPERLDEAEKKLAEEKTRLGTTVPVEVEARAADAIAEEIAKAGRERSAAFIAMSTHGRSGLRRMILGSVAEGVIRHARTPVVSIPPTKG